MTTTNYYVDGNNGDGGVEYWGNPLAWDACHDGAAGNSTDSEAIKSLVWKSADGAARAIDRGFVPIDTQALPASATISAASLFLWCIQTYKADLDAYAYLTVVQTTQPSTSAITNADYDLCGSVDSPTEGMDSGDHVGVSGASSGGYIEFVLNSTGIGWIIKGGYTKLGIREGHDVEDVANDVTGSTGLAFEGSITGTHPPYLSVTYTVPGIPILRRRREAA